MKDHSRKTTDLYDPGVTSRDHTLEGKAASTERRIARDAAKAAMKWLPLGTSPDDEVAANERFKIAKLLVEAHAAANDA